jgi:hypothetical protein
MEVAIIIAAIVSACFLNIDLGSRLYGPFQLASILGMEDMSTMLPTELEQLPSESTVILVGDARAFLFTIPMSRLRYRTVFDADTSNGRGVIEAWAGPESARRGAWLWIAPDELSRFEKTYQPLPPLPAGIADREKPFLVRPGEPVP